MASSSNKDADSRRRRWNGHNSEVHKGNERGNQLPEFRCCRRAPPENDKGESSSNSDHRSFPTAAIPHVASGPIPWSTEESCRHASTAAAKLYWSVQSQNEHLLTLSKDNAGLSEENDRLREGNEELQSTIRNLRDRLENAGLERDWHENRYRRMLEEMGRVRTRLETAERDRNNWRSLANRLSHGQFGGPGDGPGCQEAPQEQRAGQRRVEIVDGADDPAHNDSDAEEGYFEN